MLYGALTYALFLAVFLYAIAFVGDLPVPKTIDSGVASSFMTALMIDAVLLGLFAVQHSVMAPQGFKRWWTKLVPRSVERTTYVLFATVLLGLLCWQWRPMPQRVWSIGHPVGVAIMHAIFWIGWAMVLLSTFLINHFELFGLRQVYAHLTGRPLPPPAFKTPLFYRHVRHPIYLGFLLAFWATPQMTLGHLLFAAATTGYIFIGIWLEERDLVSLFGDRYRQYRTEVGMLVPKLGRNPQSGTLMTMGPDSC
jgi:protein-S-isoprenylcysteine O-methyltransferase Ste14